MKILMLPTLLAVAMAAPYISVTNNCPYQVWLGQLANNGFNVLAGSGAGENGLLDKGKTGTYTIPDGGWGGRFWPKTGCDANGNNCEAGSSQPPCPANGCQPPADTKVEFFYYPLIDTTSTPYYDISLVDGYSVPVQISPDKSGGSCVQTRCSVSLDACPQEEIDGIGDLRVTANGKTIMCLSPCKKWNYPAPYGSGKPENVDPGRLMCCPTPPVTVADCRAGNVVRSNYVKLVRSSCPTAYSYAYDDEGGLHSCPAGVNFAVTFCP